MRLSKVSALAVVLALCCAWGASPAAAGARIISLYAGHTWNLEALGAAGMLVGVGEDSPGLPGVPVVGARDGAEAIAALKPDLVLARPMHRNTRPGFLEQLERLGVTVVCLQPASPEELEPYWLELGRLCGREVAARDMARDFRQGLARLDAQVAAIPRDGRKRVFFESIHRQFKTVSPGSMAAFVLEHAGGINVAADALPVAGSNIAHFGLERLVALGDSLDVYLAQRGPMNPVSVEEIVSTPGFSAIGAVRRGQVFLVDEALTSRPTPRLLDGMRQVASILYPDQFPDRLPNGEARQ